MRKRNRVEITGKQANYLLWALDYYSKTDALGHVTQVRHGYKAYEIQELRNRLFAAHEHPEEDGTSGQDRESYSDIQDRENYS